MTPVQLTCKLIESALGELSERAEKMRDDVFLAAHAAAHEQARSAVVDIVAAVLEREHWRRIAVQGEEHAHSFVKSGAEVRTARISATRSRVQISAGIRAYLTSLRDW